MIKEKVVRKNIQSWSLIGGAVLIVVACLLAYFGTKPAEADVSLLGNPLVSTSITRA